MPSAVATATPATTAAKYAIATGKPVCASNGTATATTRAESVKNCPWAKLTMRSTPKINVSPSANRITTAPICSVVSSSCTRFCSMVRLPDLLDAASTQLLRHHTGDLHQLSAADLGHDHGHEQLLRSTVSLLATKCRLTVERIKALKAAMEKAQSVEPQAEAK